MMFGAGLSEHRVKRQRKVQERTDGVQREDEA